MASSVLVVLPEPGAAQRRSQGGIVDRDDAEVAARGIMGEQHLLVAHGLHGREDVGPWPDSGSGER